MSCSGHHLQRGRPGQHQPGRGQEDRLEPELLGQQAPGERGQALAADEHDLVGRQAPGPHPAGEEQLHGGVQAGHDGQPGGAGGEQDDGDGGRVGDQGHHHQGGRVDQAGQQDDAVGRGPHPQPGQGEGPGDGTDAQGGQQQPVAAGTEPEAAAGHQGQQRPDHGPGDHVQQRAQQDAPDHPRVADVAAAGDQGRAEPLGEVVGLDGSPPPGGQGQDQEAERERVQGEHGGHVDAGDQQAGHRRPDRPGQVHADPAQGRGRRQLGAGHQLGDQGLPGRHGQGLAAAEQEGEGQQQRRGDLTGGGQHGQHGGHDQRARLHGDQQPPTVEHVGEHPGRQGQEEHRRHVGRLDQGDQGLGGRLVDQQPLGPTVCIQVPTRLPSWASHSTRKIRIRSGAHADSIGLPPSLTAAIRRHLG